VFENVIRATTQETVIKEIEDELEEAQRYINTASYSQDDAVIDLTEVPHSLLRVAKSLPDIAAPADIDREIEKIMPSHYAAAQSLTKAVKVAMENHQTKAEKEEEEDDDDPNAQNWKYGEIY